MKRNILAGIMAFVLAAKTFAAQQPLTLVRDGKPQSVIVLGERPSKAARDAARELQTWIQRMSGAKVPIQSEDKGAADGVRILVGESKAAAQLGFDPSKFELEETWIQTFPGAVVMIGDDARPDGYPLSGTLWAVEEFAERCLGVRVL